MNIKGKMLNSFLGIAMLAGLAAPMLAQAKPGGFFTASPHLITKINKAYKTDFQAAPAVQARRQAEPQREAMIVN